MPRNRDEDDKPKFKYRGRSQEEVARRSKQSSGSYDSYLPPDAILFKPGAGENAIRILPWNLRADAKGDELAERWGTHWGVDIHIHYNVGPDEQSYLCLDKMKGEPCPVCEARRTGTEEEAEQLRISSRILCWLIDRNDEKSGPKLWSMPLGLSNDISAASQLKGGRGGGAEDGKVLMIDEPEDGYDVFFDREGEKLRTKYKRVEVSRESSPISEKVEVQERWLAYIADPPLPERLNYFDAEHIEKVLFGQGTAEDREDAGSARSSRRGRAEPEEEADDSPRPSRRGGGAAEEEAPARGRRRGSAAEEDPPSEERPRRRGAAEPEEETSQDYDHEGDEATASSRRGSQERRRGRAEPEDEAPSEETPRGRRRGAPEEEAGDDAPRGRERTSERRRGREEPSEEDEGSAEGARGRLARLGQRGRR